MTLGAGDALLFHTNASSDLPPPPKYTNKDILTLVSQAVGKQLSPKTLRRWRQQTGLTDPFLGDREVWILSIYGRFMGIYRRPKKAYNAAEQFINNIEESRYESAN